MAFRVIISVVVVALATNMVARSDAHAIERDSGAHVVTDEVIERMAGPVGWHVDSFNEEFYGKQGHTILKYVSSDATNPPDILQVNQTNYTICANLSVNRTILTFGRLIEYRNI